MDGGAPESEMAERTLESKIELEVRRILAAEELQVRKAISNDLREFSGLLQAQFRTLTWGLGVLFLAGGGIVTFLFGKSYAASQERIVREVDQKVIEYRIVESYRKILEDQINTIVQGEEVAAQIDAAVRYAASLQIQTGVAEIVGEKVAEELKDLKTEELDTLLKDALELNKMEIAGISSEIGDLRGRLKSWEEVGEMRHEILREELRKWSLATRDLLARSSQD